MPMAAGALAAAWLAWERLRGAIAGGRVWTAPGAALGALHVFRHAQMGIVDRCKGAVQLLGWNAQRVGRHSSGSGHSGTPAKQDVVAEPASIAAPCCARGKNAQLQFVVASMLRSCRHAPSAGHPHSEPTVTCSLDQQLVSLPASRKVTTHLQQFGSAHVRCINKGTAQSSAARKQSSQTRTGAKQSAASIGHQRHPHWLRKIAAAARAAHPQAGAAAAQLQQPQRKGLRGKQGVRSRDLRYK